MLFLAAITVAGSVYIVWQKRRVDKSDQKSCQPKVEGFQGTSAICVNEDAVPTSKESTPEQSTASTLEAAQKLKDSYEQMKQKFLAEGLDVESVSKSRMYFSGLEPEDVTSSPGSRVVAPKRYADDWPGGPLAANGVRLIVLPLDSDLKVSSAAESVTRDVLKQLSFIKDVFRNVRSGYHVTLYHTSKMMYPCPDATHPTGGVDSSTPPHERPGPTKEILERELQICKDAASGCGRISLEFERVVFTETGTLLLTWTDSTGNIERLRAGFRTHFPGAQRIPQSNIIHVSLLRVLCVQELDVYIRQKIDSVCSKWTTRLAGTTWEPDTLMHVCEECFSTIEGEHHRYMIQ